ncbi:RNA polymerase sigma factor [Pedosphaera parvula]|uniref:RNA polymerase, sigma-24 subunit, ECF subfamily n=1 Tax=Pedosphaera parvula (strain Ellin514) TaxID=320771 RepID=B9XC19_PEDPL|nr:RNA polymerase sigma factor [Pedosphaera parvula]EEF62487.1 RNA polymerase, sigma-24 subunit, ECF subfamily [Pedosphaera parvula Ellin514]
MIGSILKSLPSIFSATDEQAMWRVKMEDDPQAFAQLVKRWEKPIQSLCARMTGDLHRGEDLAQETFTRIYAKRKEYEPSGKFSTFIWRVALNISYDELRKINRRGEMTLEEDEESGREEIIGIDASTPELRLVEQERADMVRTALLKLGEPYRTVVVMRHYEGLKFREIAEVLQIPEGTVKSRMVEALSQLNRILSQVTNVGETSCNRSKQRNEIPLI